MTISASDLKKMTDGQLKTQLTRLETAIARAMGSLYPNIWAGEIGQIKKELMRRNPKTVYYTVDVDSNDCGVRFFYKDDKGKEKRVHPRKPQGGTRYPQDLTADEINAWMYREGITHVFADTEDETTSPECIKRGRHTRAAFVKWWRQLEQD